MSASELKVGDAQTRLRNEREEYSDGFCVLPREAVYAADGEITALRAEVARLKSGFDVRTAAERIAESLFVNGMGNRAQRLVLTVDKPTHRDLGGWCFGAVVDRIESGMRESTGRVVADEPDEAPVAEVVEALRSVVFWCNKDGSPCDGFRFREEVLKAERLLKKYYPSSTDHESQIVADEPWVEKAEAQLQNMHRHVDDLTNDQIRQAIEAVVGMFPAPREAEEVADAKSDDTAEYPPFDIEQCKRDNGAALKVGGFETNKGHAPIPVRVLSFGGYGGSGRCTNRLPVEFNDGTWGRVKIRNLANIGRVTFAPDASDDTAARVARLEHDGVTVGPLAGTSCWCIYDRHSSGAWIVRSIESWETRDDALTAAEAAKEKP